MPRHPFFIFAMNKREQNKILKLNNLLVGQFGIPPRNESLPDPVDMLIATILSQNTNDRNSYKAYLNLKNNYSNWEKLKNEKRDVIESHIKIAGLGKQKSAAIKNFLTELYSKTGKLSLNYLIEKQSMEAIEELSVYKGVGVKTASCVMLFALDRNVCPVDTHVHRTLNRIGIVKTSAPEKTFFFINNNFPEKIAHQFHTNLIRLGREICIPRKPKCGICPVEKLCKFNEKNFDSTDTASERAFMLLDNV